MLPKTPDLKSMLIVFLLFTSATIIGCDSNNGASSPLGNTLLSIVVAPVNPSTTIGQTVQFTATGVYSDGSTQNMTDTVEWTTDSPAVASISNEATKKGLVTPNMAGSTTISASHNGISSNDSLESSTLTVTPTLLESIAITPVNPSTALGVNVQFTATGHYSDGTTADISADVIWQSASPTITDINTTGLATSLVAGTSIISAPLGDINSSDSTQSSTLTVTAAELVSIAVTPTNPSTPLGVDVQFTATGVFTDGSNQDLTTQVSWDSATPATADISNTPATEGSATPAAIGTTLISASFAGVNSSDSAQSSTLTVTAAELVSIAVTPTNPSTPLGVDVQFTATGVFTDGSNQDLTTQVSWDSATPATADISNTPATEGLATPAAIGTTLISASLAGINSSDSTQSSSLTVTAAELVSIEVTPADPATPLGVQVQFTATGTYTDASTQNLTTSVTWNSATPGTANISNAVATEGLATPIAVGTTLISASLGGIDSDDSSQSSTLTVSAAELVSIEVTPADPATPLGVAVQFTATGTYTDASTQNLTTSVTWDSATPGTAIISNAAASEGLATPLTTGTTLVSASFNGISSDDSFESSTLTVNPAELVSIEVTPNNPSIYTDLTQAFVATGTYTDASTQDLTTQVTWISETTATATISNALATEGLATPVAPGSTTIDASHAGSGIRASDTGETALLQVTDRPSCASILGSGAGITDGVYTIDTDGTGAQAPFNVYCDMTSDGGGWTLIVAQYEGSPVADWNQGIQVSYDPTLASQTGFTLSTPEIPAHTQTAFGQDLTATSVGYADFVYTTGDIAETAVMDQISGNTFWIFRSATSYYHNHDPDNTLTTAIPGWYDTLTYNWNGPLPSYQWAFSPNQGVIVGRGYAMETVPNEVGITLETTSQSFAWTVWVR